MAGRLLTPDAAYWTIAGAGAFLVVFGLVMVLSASSVESYAQTGTPFSTVARQALFAVIGVPLALVAARLPLPAVRALAWPALGVAVALQALTLIIGREVNGNRSWLEIGPVQIQPAELVKLALVVWVADVLARKQRLLHRLPHLLIPLVPGAGLPLALVVAGHDIGTASVVLVMVAVMVFVAGARLRHIGAAVVLAAAGLVVSVVSAAHRMDRVRTWVAGGCTDTDYLSTCWQPTHGQWALASGGWWGLGLGGGREKWAWLPEAHNDYIFAVIGEELGLPGTLVVLLAYVVLAVAALAVARACRDSFVSIATAGVLGWIVGQALLNIGVVLGLLPVAGVPLPLISSGGSSLVTTMVALGLLAAFGRHARAHPAAAVGAGPTGPAPRPRRPAVSR